MADQMIIIGYAKGVVQLYCACMQNIVAKDLATAKQFWTTHSASCDWTGPAKPLDPVKVGTSQDCTAQPVISDGTKLGTVQAPAPSK